MCNRHMALALVMTLFMVPAVALAQESFEGVVAAGDTLAITAPFGGTVEAITLREGALIHQGDTVASIATTKTVAPVDGTVRGIFADAGDTLSQTTVLYIAPLSKYTVTCTIGDAYDSVENTYVTLGEKVYIRCKPDGTHKAEGIVTAVDGASFTVMTTAGELYLEETVYIYRSSAYTYKSRIGSGQVARTVELAITASGSLLSLAVADGDAVERGQLLFETVDGELDASVADTSDIKASAAGVVAAVNVKAGQSIQQGDVIATLYPQGSYVIEFAIQEDLLSTVSIGDGASITFLWKEEQAQSLRGTVTGISYVSVADTVQTEDGEAAADSQTVEYMGYISFDATADVRLGMSVTVTVD